MDIRQFATVSARREALAKYLGVNLEAIGASSLSDKDYQGKCENPIGTVQIPVGVAGPLLTKSEKQKAKSYYIPLATTEGALVASVNRGCKAIAESGGVDVVVENVGISRGPVFRVKGAREGVVFRQWVSEHVKELDTVARQTSSHLKLVDALIKQVGKNVFIRFSFDTADAMGMNMATIATQAIVQFIEKETSVACIALAGNFDIDKKPAWLNVLSGRGKVVWADIIVKKEVVEEVLKTSGERVAEVVYRKNLLGSAMAGSLGFNAHYANIIAAIYAATGQDLAHVVEGSLGITTAEMEKNGDLYFSIYLPSVVVGTVGGGTGLPTQREALSLLGVAGGQEGKNALTFASIIGGAVLAGELSLLASLAQGTLAKTHERFRKKAPRR